VFEFVGPKAYSYNVQSGELYLFALPRLVIGAKDEGSERAIRGKPIGIAYVDEVTLAPEPFRMMLTSRMSPRDARLYATTNTDSRSSSCIGT
jgi:hypothetical protein